MPRLLIEKGPDRGKSLSIIAGKTLIAGRDAAVDLQLSDNMASRRHFKIANKGEAWGLIDLNSANGTLVNGKKSDGAVRLQVGDSIQIGETLISFLADEKEDRSGLIGQQIGGYRIEERLGRGAMGTVYKAIQLSLSRTIALKVLSQDLVRDDKFCEMFVKEARAAGGLNHPNIVQVYDVGDEAGQYFFSMEYAQKGSVLEEMGKGGSLDMVRALSVIKQTCAALDYGERKGLVHRDIKPDNLMVMEDGTVKLGDLGLAMSGKETEEHQDGVFGTPHYIAPEQAMGKPVDHRADIYALGATFYRMLAGRTLYTGTTVKEILKKQVREPHEPITDHVPDCPQAISNVIDRMLAKEPAERYQHASDILNDIANYEALSSRQSSVMSGTFAERPMGLSGHQSQQVAEINAKRNLLVAVVAAGLALVAASIVIYLFVFKSDPPKQNNVVVSPNNNQASNNTPTGDDGNDPTPEVPKHVKEANEALNTALIQADMLAREGTIKALQKARDLLFNAKAKAPDAEKDVIKKASDQIDAYDKKIDELIGSGDQLQIDLDEMKRQVVGEIDKFKYSGAKALGFAYRDKLEKDPSDAAKDMLTYLKKYLKTDLPAQSQRHLGKFIAKIGSELDIARRELKAVNSLKLLTPIKEKVEDAETACDDETYKMQLTTLKESIIKLEKQKKNAAQQDDNAVKFADFRIADRKLDSLLAVVRGHVALGNFKAAEDALSDFETTCAEYHSYKNDKLFAPLVNDVRLRREQSEYELAGILALSKANRWIPRLASLLKENPWPTEFADIIGGDNFIIQFKMAKSGDPSWSLEIRDPSDISTAITKKASDFRTPAMRKALGEAVGLILLNTEIMSEIDHPVSKGGPSALVGLYAWMLELGANGQAYEVINYRYHKVKEGDSDYAVTREYYAYGLLAKAMQLNGSGNKSGAEALLRELDSKFSDTRAAKGRS